MTILPYDHVAAAWHGVERARLEAEGTPAPFVDGQIAAIAKRNDLILVTAWRCVYDGRRSIWALTYHKAVERLLSIAYFARWGLCSLADVWLSRAQHITASRQLLLPLG